ncbi:MAG: class II glutamine amidotransferase [Euryarchaeota archaeon]|nr:class II glutamine amidotransferase [Euryarchaeota archaeon]
MCELLGLSFKHPITPSLSFKGFRHRGEKNPDGWGVAFYPDESVQIIKEAIKSNESSLSKFLENYSKIKSKIFIAHVRESSQGMTSYKNTHPFLRELNSKEYAFAHNGTLENYKAVLEISSFRPVGETDSEHAFCHIMNCIKDRSINKWINDDFKWLKNKFLEVNSFGKFNCILTDGEFLFCYRDINGSRKLHYTYRKAPYNRFRLKDEDLEVNIHGEEESGQSGFIIATNPLTSEKWDSFKFGELIVFKGGKIVFS